MKKDLTMKNDDEEISSEEENNLEGNEDNNLLDDDELFSDEEDEDDSSLLNESKLSLKKNQKKRAFQEDEEEEEENNIDLHPRLSAKIARLHTPIADVVRFQTKDASALIVHKKHHRLSPLCVCVSSDDKFVVSCSKDGSIVKYSVESRACVGSIVYEKSATTKTHKGLVMCCAISPNDRVLVTGGVDHLIKVWDFATLTFVRDFAEHRGPITSLAFRKHGTASTELFSASTDRSIKIWDLDQMGIMNTLYGHYTTPQQLDCLAFPRVLSCGGSDRSCRLFKVFEDSHLVFNAPVDCVSVDTVALINEDHFVSGDASGSICVWTLARKKPACIVRLAHGKLPNGEPRWISAVATNPYTDLVASGSSDGLLRLWKVSVDYKQLTLTDQFSLDGFINSIRFAKNLRFVACAVGQEHKSGRWWRIAAARNSITLVPLTGGDGIAANGETESSRTNGE